MVGNSLRVLGLLFPWGAYFFTIYILYVIKYRISSWDEVVFISWIDVLVGALVAVVIMLFVGGSYSRDSWERWLRLAAVALLLGAFATVPLLYLHWNQYCSHAAPEVKENEFYTPPRPGW